MLALVARFLTSFCSAGSRRRPSRLHVFSPLLGLFLFVFCFRIYIFFLFFFSFPLVYLFLFVYLFVCYIFIIFRVYIFFFNGWKGEASGWLSSAVTEQRASWLNRLGSFVEGFNFKTQRPPPPPPRCWVGSFNEGSWFIGSFLYLSFICHSQRLILFFSMCIFRLCWIFPLFILYLFPELYFTLIT